MPQRQPSKKSGKSKNRIERLLSAEDNMGVNGDSFGWGPDDEEDEGFAVPEPRNGARPQGHARPQEARGLPENGGRRNYRRSNPTNMTATQHEMSLEEYLNNPDVRAAAINHLIRDPAVIARIRALHGIGQEQTQDGWMALAKPALWTAGLGLAAWLGWRFLNKGARGFWKGLWE